MILRVGIDIGSTTVKVVVLDENNELLFRSYERHYSKARERACETLRSIEDMLRGKDVRLVVTGSAGLGVAKAAGLDFVQEVYATAAAVNTYIPDTDASWTSCPSSMRRFTPSPPGAVCSPRVTSSPF